MKQTYVIYRALGDSALKAIYHTLYSHFVLKPITAESGRKWIELDFHLSTEKMKQCND